MWVQHKAKRPKMAAYQKFFQGYTEVKVARKSGKGFKVVRIYTAPYQVHDMPDLQWKLQKLWIGLLSTVSLGLYLFAATRYVAGNTVAIVLIPGSFAAAALAFALVWVLIYESRGRRMTVYDSKSSSKNLKLWSATAAALLLCAGAANGIHLLFGSKSAIAGEVLCTAAYLLSGGSMLFVYKIEKQTDYCEVENDTVLPFDRHSEI